MLEGVRIIEIEGLGPGPFAGMTFADLGAEVIVVHRREPPTPNAPERNLLDRGKQSIVLDLKDEPDVGVLKRLLATADGLIEGFRPGVMERLGLGPEDLRRDHPRLVYGRITGWGQNGPLAKNAGHDLNYIAVSGALWYASPPGQPPCTPPTVVGDIGGGAMYLVTGMLAAMLRARGTGQGTVVDAAIVDGSAHMLNLLMSAQSAGLLAADRGTSLLDGPPWSRCYACADGQWLSVQCLEPGFYAEFRRLTGVGDDPDFEQNPDPGAWPAMSARFEALFADKPRDEWLGIFADSDACVAPVLSPADSARHPHLAARETWTTVDGQLQARTAPRFDGRTPGDPGIAPKRGEHTQEIIDGLGRQRTLG